MSRGISFQFYDARKFIESDVSPAGRIYLPGIQCEQILSENSETAEKLKSALELSGKEIYFVTPYVNRGVSREYFTAEIERILPYTKGFLLQNAGDVNIMKQYGKNVAADYSFNITNSAAACALSALSGNILSTICILPEHNEKDAMAIARKFPENVTPEIIGGGKYIVMRSEHCFICTKEGYHCGKCGKYYMDGSDLTDTAGRNFKIIGDADCRSVMLSPAPEESPAPVEKNDGIMRRFIFT